MTLLVGLTIGLIYGLAAWRWLRTGTYRCPTDTPRARLAHTWVAVPIATAAGAISATLWATEPWLALAAAAYLAMGVVVVWIDVDVHRIPNRALVIAAVVMAGALSWGVVGGHLQWWVPLVGAVGFGLLFFVVALFSSMGLGDVKLAAVTGMLLAPLEAYNTFAAALLVAAIAAVVIARARGRSRSDHIALGPVIVTATAVATLTTGAW